MTFNLLDTQALLNYDLYNRCIPSPSASALLIRDHAPQTSTVQSQAIHYLIHSCWVSEAHHNRHIHHIPTHVAPQTRTI